MKAKKVTTWKKSLFGLGRKIMSTEWRFYPENNREKKFLEGVERGSSIGWNPGGFRKKQFLTLTRWGK